ncbi:MAG: F0F1 ATP synthase subunit A [Bacteroidales bacterium]|nr:F0F1 ATP synthase subunit A [Bacteroidales bacterium]
MKLKILFILLPFLSLSWGVAAQATPAEAMPTAENTSVETSQAAASEAEAAAAEGTEAFNPGSMIIGHVTDAHSWHMFDFVGKDGREHVVGVNLPIILVNDGHLVMFSSRRFEHGHADYRGFRLVGGGAEKEEIVCVDDAGQVVVGSDGKVKKPVDLSLTKTSAAILIAVALLIVLVLSAARQARRRGTAAPRGLQSLVEILVLHVRNDIVAPMLGGKTDKYLPYLLTLFFFILFCNVLGLIPFFPAGANITGNIAVTAILAVITFLITNLSGNRHYWKDIFNTPGVPAWLKVFPLMPVVELLGVFTKPLVLMIRLFANMTAGHIVILGFVSVIFILGQTYGVVAGGAMSVFSVLFSVFISVLECLVAYLQAFVFTMLSALYIGMAIEEPEGETA